MTSPAIIKLDFARSMTSWKMLTVGEFIGFGYSTLYQV